MRVLVVDIGGSHVKLAIAGTDLRASVDSTPDMSPRDLLEAVTPAAREWSYDVVSLGYPGHIGGSGPTKEPGNLGSGWVGFDFDAAFGKPVRVVNDAVMQALGAYHGGRMLFLGLGTGVGSALVSERVMVPLELGELPYRDGHSLTDTVGRKGLDRLGEARWRSTLLEVVPALRRALMADYVVLGGGNAARMDPLPEHTECGGNDDAIEGGHRLWRDAIEPIDSTSAPFWRVVP
jgi:polyphosphate glucokinase